MWREALTLASDMLDYWTSKPSVDTSAADLRTLSLHVLSRAGFGKSFKFESQEQRKAQDLGASTGANYKDSLQTILENCVLILGLGTKFIAQPWLPKKLRCTIRRRWRSVGLYRSSRHRSQHHAERKTAAWR